MNTIYTYKLIEIKYKYNINSPTENISKLIKYGITT